MKSKLTSLVKIFSRTMSQIKKSVLITIFLLFLGNCDAVTSHQNFPCPITGIHFFPNEYSCTEYVLCVDGIPYFMECPEGLLFDRVLGECNYADKVNCKVICPSSGVALIRDPRNRDEYHICNDGRKVFLVNPNQSVCLPLPVLRNSGLMRH